MAAPLGRHGHTGCSDGIIAEAFRSKVILAGSSTLNNGRLYALLGLAAMIKGLKIKKKSAAVFENYGCGGEPMRAANPKPERRRVPNRRRWTSRVVGTRRGRARRLCAIRQAFTGSVETDRWAING